jgi:eukaryotic-like serine/threonine-protein kinase
VYDLGGVLAVFEGGKAMTDPSRLHFAHFEVSLRDDGAPWELGRGAMGVTYKAYDPDLRVYVALKVINPAQVGDAKTRALFLREARAAARVHHANVGNVVFLNPDPENMFYAMEFIAGESLRDWLHSRVPLSPLMAVGLSLQIARGLEAIHREEVIHRDLKPTNLMIVRADKQRQESDPEAWLIKIIDFGLARNIAGDVSETSAVAGTTGFRGTALYASPEQCEERRDLDGRADLYSLGCVMWEMLVGMPPFSAKVHRELLNAHVAKTPPLQQLSHLPTGLQAVVARLLLKDRDARFADAGDLVRALEKCREQIARGDSPAAMPESFADETTAATTDLPASKPMTELGGSRRWQILTGGVAVAILVAAWLLWKRSADPAAASHSNATAAGVPAATKPHANPALDIPAKSVAVLPFEDLGGSTENQSLADAIQEDVLTDLSKIADLKVVARSSVMRYRNSSERNLAEIGQQLGVRYVTEGSVQRAGDKMRVSVKLIDTHTGAPIWAERYDKPITDVFALQADLAKAIAEQLKVKLTPAEKSTIETPQTTDLVAYDLYVRAREIVRADPGIAAAAGEKGEQTMRLLDQALERDPDFLPAHRMMVVAADKYAMNASTEAAKQKFSQKAEASLAAARRLAPDSPETRLTEAHHYYRKWDSRSYGLARQKLDQVLAAQPNNAEAWLLLGELSRKVGPIEEALQAFQRAVQLDPNEIYAVIEAATCARWLRRYELARELHLKAAKMMGPPDSCDEILAAADVERERSGDLNPLRKAIQQIIEVNPGPLTEERLLGARMELASAERDAVEMERLIALAPASKNLFIRIGVANDRIDLANLRGDRETSITLAKSFIPELEAEVKRLAGSKMDPIKKGLARMYKELSIMRAEAGDKEGAIADAKASCDLMKPEIDYLWAMGMQFNAAMIYSFVGERDLALDLLEELAARPSPLSYGDLTLGNAWDSLRQEPRFKALLARLAPKDAKTK